MSTPNPSPWGTAPAAAAPARPARGTMIFTFGMTALIVAIQAYAASLPARELNAFYADYAFVPGRITEFGDVMPGAWLTFLSHALLHGSWQHLAFNAYALIAFGLIAERTLGFARTALLYAGSAIGGAALFMALHLDEMIFLVGASGAISGLFGAALLIAPPGARRAVMSNAVIWFGLNVVMPALASYAGGAIAWEAHLGGFIAGAALAWGLRPRRPRFDLGDGKGGERGTGGPGGRGLGRNEPGQTMGPRNPHGANPVGPGGRGADRNEPGQATGPRNPQGAKQSGPVVRR